MTNTPAMSLIRQRHNVVAQIAIERAAIAKNAVSLRQLSHVIDTVSVGIQHLKQHPETLLLPAVIAVVFRPVRLLTLAFSGIGLWRMVQTWRQRVLS
ncbi:MAG: YqjK family protein [Sulfuricaulis sp.]